MSKPKPDKPAERQDTPETFRHQCHCGHAGTVTLRHWEKITCRQCGHPYLCVQRRKGGPLSLEPIKRSLSAEAETAMEANSH